MLRVLRMSSSGLASSTRKSAILPGASVPRSFRLRNSAARLVAAIRGFYRFLVLDGALTQNPADDLPREVHLVLAREEGRVADHRVEQQARVRAFQLRAERARRRRQCRCATDRR